MPNMSYCRFENTARDVYDCLEHMEDENLCEYEQRARAKLIKYCRRIADEYAPTDEEE
jgi:hypothetical protein